MQLFVPFINRVSLFSFGNFPQDMHWILFLPRLPITTTGVFAHEEPTSIFNNKVLPKLKLCTATKADTHVVILTRPRYYINVMSSRLQHPTIPKLIFSRKALRSPMFDYSVILKNYSYCSFQISPLFSLRNTWFTNTGFSHDSIYVVSFETIILHYSSVPVSSSCNRKSFGWVKDMQP